MGVQQLIAEREYQVETHRLRSHCKVTVPRGAGRIQLPSRKADIMPAIHRFEPEIMAHPDIVIDRIAITQSMDLAQQAFGCLIVAVIISGCHFEPVFGQHYIAGIKHDLRPVAAYAAQFDPSFGRGRKMTRSTGINRRDQRQKHLVDIACIDRVRLPGQKEAAVEFAEIQGNLGIFRRTAGIVPQPHIPAFRPPRGIAPRKRQRRTVDGIQRHQAMRAPAKAQRKTPVIPVGFIGEKRMVPTVFAFPDQTREIVFFVKNRIGAQAIRAGGHHRSHHRSGEIDRPETGVEAHHRTALLPLPFFA